MLVYVSEELTLRITSRHDIAQVRGRPVLRRQNGRALCIICIVEYYLVDRIICMCVIKVSLFDPI